MILWRNSLSSVHIAIVHYPVYDKNGHTIATSITNVELHDIARTCMTFGIEVCYIVTPLPKQRTIMERLMHHWKSGYGAQYNPLRGMALEKIRIAESVPSMIASIEGNPVVIGTSSHVKNHDMIGYRELREMIQSNTRPVLILFGTGWGLTDEVLHVCDTMLEPIKGTGHYNHLSLRVAVGIILDRIFSDRGGDYE